MNTDIKMLVDRWYYFLMFKPDYFNGHDEINQKVYTELLEETYFAIKEMRQFIDSKKYEDVEPDDMYWYIEMISVIAKYGELPVTDDSENYVYTATALLATEFFKIASAHKWNAKLNKGIIEAVPGEEYGITKKIKYDINKGNLSGYLEVANEMMK